MSQPLPQPPVLTGQDIAEAQGALTLMLERSLAGTGASRHEYVLLRALEGRGPYASAKELHEYLAGQPQLGLSAAGVAELLTGLEERGLAAGTALDSLGPAQATPEGTALLAELTQIVAPLTSVFDLRVSNIHSELRTLHCGELRGL